MKEDNCQVLTDKEVRDIMDLAIRQAQQKRTNSYAQYQQDDVAYNELRKLKDEFEKKLYHKEVKK